MSFSSAGHALVTVGGQRPDIAAELHPIKNGSLTAGDVTKKSAQDVWWLCKAGHEWQQLIKERTGKKRPCQDQMRVTPIQLAKREP